MRSKRAFFSSMHRLLGVWGLFFNIFICITGIRIGYAVVSHAITGNDSAVNVPVINQSIDTLLAEAKKTFPAFKVTYLRFPANAESALLLMGHLQSDPSYYGKFYSNITIDYQTGSIEGIVLLKDKPWHDRLLTILQPLHFGDYAGFWVKLIYTIGGLLPGILSVSGFIIWQYRSVASPFSSYTRPDLLKTKA